MKKTYIVDGNSLLFRAYYSTAYTGNLMTNSKGIPVNAIFAFHNLIKKIKAQLDDGDNMFVAFDTGHKTIRKDEFEEYKAQRAPAPQELVAQMPIAREMLEAMNIFWAEREGYEGDDLAGSMAKKASDNGDEVTLFTSDKDFLQLLDISENVHVCFLKRGLTDTIDYTKKNLHDLIGLNPDQITDFKGIAGDSSDNYKGIPGIGEKTAMKLLNEHGHLEEIIDFCQNDKSKASQKIYENKDKAIFFKKLATIFTDLEIDEEYKKSKYSHYEKKKLSQFYLKYQLNQFLSKIDSMKGIVNDENSVASMISLFDMAEDEEYIEKKDEIDIKEITSFNEIKQDVFGLTFDSDNENENIANLKGFAIASNKCVYLLKHQDAIKDESFLSYLTSKEEKSVYDLKSLLVLLNRFGYPKIENVTFDLLIATYLLNPDCGQKRKDLFYSYNVELSDDKNIAAQTIAYVISLKSQVLSALESHEETNLFNDVEMPLSKILANMEIEGFPIDKDILEEINIDYQNKLKSLENKIYEYAGKEFNINSPKQLETVLFTDMGLSRYRGEKGTGIEVLTAHQDDHPIYRTLIEYRLYNKLVSSYTSALPKHIQEDKKIHAIYNQALTSTGRLSMSEPNLQNISIRNEEGKLIRKAFFYPNKEFYLLSLDYSQIELRVLAHMGNIKALIDIFNSGEDIHQATAAKVYNIPLDEVTHDMRRKAKAVNFGIIYGISAYGLSQQLDIPVEEASSLIKQFKATFDGINTFQDEAIKTAKEKGYVSTILNRRRYLQDINSSNRFLRAFSERAAVNTIIQGSAADLIKVAMVKCSKILENYKTKLVLQIHDELIFKVPKEELSTILPLLKECMEKAMSLKVPLKAEGEAALTWYEAH